MSFYWIRDAERMLDITEEGFRLDLAAKCATAVLSPKDFRKIALAWRRRAGILKGELEHAKRNVRRLFEAVSRARSAPRGGDSPEAT